LCESSFYNLGKLFKLFLSINLHVRFLPPQVALYSGMLFLSVLFSPCQAATGDEDDDYEEISVYVNLLNVKGQELSALYSKENLYISVTDLFTYLHIRCTTSEDLNAVEGFFINQNDRYLIDKANNSIVFKKIRYPLKADDLIKGTTGLYLKTACFDKIFGLNCVFNFRSLSLSLKTQLDLPVIREKRLEELRTNINRLKREVKADSIIPYGASLANFGAVDWSVISSQQTEGYGYTRISVKAGAMIAGGEATVNLTQQTDQQFSERQQYYRWRYVNNENDLIKQFTVGKIAAQSISSIYFPVVGVQITNTPTVYRKSFADYTISDFTHSGWTVELYVNNMLVDYVKADASGFYTFKVPLIYGGSNVQLHFYGPDGEEHIQQKHINVPYNFLPPKELEYTFSAGILEDGRQSQFSRFDLNYGLSQYFTVGGGVEYLSNVNPHNAMPFVSTSFRALNNLLIAADYTYGVRARTILSYRLPHDMLFELNYTKYNPRQTAISYNYLEVRKAGFSFPFRTKKLSGFSRATFNQIIFPGGRQTAGEYVLSASSGNISTNLKTNAIIFGQSYSNVYSTLALSFRLLNRFTLKPQAQYMYNTGNISEIRCNLDKQILHNSYLNLSYQNNLNYGISSFNMGLRLDLSFVRAAFSARQSNQTTILTESFQGSLLFNQKASSVKLNNRSSVGTGGLVVYTYLDLNANNKRDKNEPKITGLKLKINGAGSQNVDRDTSIRIYDLIPYTNYYLELDRNSFDNIGWQIKNAVIKVTAEPNNLKTIEIPVRVLAEASGTVSFNHAASTEGIGRILVNFYNAQGQLAGKTQTEQDGYFSYLGLLPGNYKAEVDAVQLKNLKMHAKSALFKVLPKIDGDVVDGLKLEVYNNEKEVSSSGNQQIKIAPKILKKTNKTTTKKGH
jgi:hypothetical protein